MLAYLKLRQHCGVIEPKVSHEPEWACCVCVCVSLLPSLQATAGSPFQTGLSLAPPPVFFLPFSAALRVHVSPALSLLVCCMDRLRSI